MADNQDQQEYAIMTRYNNLIFQRQKTTSKTKHLVECTFYAVYLRKLIFPQRCSKEPILSSYCISIFGDHVPAFVAFVDQERTLWGVGRVMHPNLENFAFSQGKNGSKMYPYREIYWTKDHW